jgi:hypothetical protein
MSIAEAEIDLSHKMNRSLSYYECDRNNCNIDICMTSFISKIPKWGGQIENENNAIIFKNTCSFDYFLLSLWTAKQLSPKLNKYFDEKHKSTCVDQAILNVIDLIENDKWNQAKYLWLNDICKISPNESGEIDCEGSVYGFFGKHIEHYQSFFRSPCPNTECRSNKNESTSNLIQFNMLFGDLNHSLESANVTCSRCGCDYIQKCRFAFESPPFLFIETDGITTIKFDNLPKSLDILGNT